MFAARARVSKLSAELEVILSSHQSTATATYEFSPPLSYLMVLFGQLTSPSAFRNGVTKRDAGGALSAHSFRVLPRS